MIKPEQVPDVVFDAFQKAWSHKSTLSTKECLAAAINAWPGMKHTTELYKRTPSLEIIILPLPQEKPHE